MRRGKNYFFTYSTIPISVVDPDPEGSETFCRIRIPIRNSRLWIRIRIRIRNWTWILLKIIKKISNLIIMTFKIHLCYIFFEKFALKSIRSHLKSLALWKSECLGPDPKLFTSQVGSGSKLGGKWDPDPKKIVSDPQHWYRYCIVYTNTG
jgi:hypothetical protein